MLPASDARVLFAHAAGQPPPDGDGAEPMAELVSLCGLLPLAIRIAAARLRSHPTWTVPDLITRLRDRTRRLTELADEAGARGVAAALDVSYQQLPTEQRRLYRQLSLGRVHQMQGRCQPALDALAAALEIARTTGNRPGQLNALIGLGRVCRLQGRHEQAFDRFARALEIARADGDRNGEMNALRGLGHLHLVGCRYGQAGEALAAGLEIARATGNRGGEVSTLLGLGHVDRRQERPERAAGYYRKALTLARETGDRNLQFEALQGLGRLYHTTGQHAAAIAHHQPALELGTELAQPADQARAHDGIARTYRALGRPDEARGHWQHALDILTDLGITNPEEEEVSTSTIRAHLTELMQRGCGRLGRTAPDRRGPLGSLAARPTAGMPQRIAGRRNLPQPTHYAQWTSPVLI